MKIRYTNPFVKHPETVKKLKDYMKKSQPITEPDPVVNFIEDWKKPLFSQNVSEDKAGMLTTCRSWMPTGQNLKSLTD